MKIIQEFKEFAIKGNMIDLAGVMDSPVLEELALPNFSATNAAGTAPSFFLGVISASAPTVTPK